MSYSVKSCQPGENLASLAHLMWDGDCGAIPVVDAERHPVGIITDRDAFIALATRFRAPGDITVQEVMTAEPVTCHPDDDVRLALKTMAEHQVRRLPVVDGTGALAGMLSLSDLAARSTARPSAIDAEIAQTLQAISRSHHEPAVSVAMDHQVVLAAS
jgi:CBS domain-containing protein